MPRKRPRTGYYESAAWYTPSAPVRSAVPVVQTKREQAIFASRFRSETICILVGREGTPYYLHSEVLEQSSPYFARRAAFFDKSGSETPERAGERDRVHWEAVTRCEVFDLLVEYLYQDEYAAPNEFSTAKKCEVHAQLYRLAEYLMVDDLKDTALDKLTTLLKENMHAYIGRALKPQEILRLLAIAYGGNVDELGSISPVETDDVKIIQNYGTFSETATPLNDDQDIAASLSPPQATLEQLDAETQSNWPDPLQQLVARYAAVQLEYLQKEPVFSQIVVDGGHMVRDIMLAAQPASTM